MFFSESPFTFTIIYDLKYILKNYTTVAHNLPIYGDTRLSAQIIRYYWAVVNPVIFNGTEFNN